MVALAYYQWYTGRSFMKIYHAVSIEEILNMYPVYHEMDISRFVETINEKWDQYYVETNLKRLRMLSGLSQSEPGKEEWWWQLRQIQLFEQRQRDNQPYKGD